jgi:UDP-N-acetylmuramate dehydrogenase
MQVAQNVSLANYSTMRLGGKAAYATSVSTQQELIEALAWAKQQGVAAGIIGSGSNIVWRDEGFAGLLIVNKIQRFEIFEEDEQNVYVTVGSGENWDETVARCVEKGLTGIEALSFIPGTAGATPVQNVGAYGQEIAQTLVSVEAYDTASSSMVTIQGIDCKFGYRTSRFKTTDRGRFFITAITLHLMKGNPQPPFYGALQHYFEDHGYRTFTPKVVREAVIAIRRAKLPDPTIVANNGSFFANPIITDEEFAEIQVNYPDAPHWPVSEPGKTKVPAAWLLEQAGFKDFHDPETGMATWHAQPLVLVNESAKSTNDLIAFMNKITTTVKAKFGVDLQPEPELLP